MSPTQQTRRSRLSDITDADITANQARFPGVFGDTRGQRWFKRALVLGGSGYLVFCVWAFEITIEKLFGGFGKNW